MQDELYMRRCFELALRGAGRVAPNPMVGAVLVHNDRIIGEGWHRQYGQAHAEVNCLESVAPEHRALISDSTMYVSLEPCAHTGKTPPCALRLVREGIRKVIIANPDPFEQVAGAGIRILKEAGVETKTGILAAEGNWLNRRFFSYHRLRRPYIILKWAQSADGFIAPEDRRRTQLSNPYSTTLTHRWRTEEAAIMVGYKTALHDDPALTARNWQGLSPLRIALDRQLRLPQTHQLYDEAAPTWILNELIDKTTGNVYQLKTDFSQDVLTQLSAKLYEAGRLSLIVEGGAALLQSFIDAGLWDEARVFRTQPVLGSGIGTPRLSQANLAQEYELANDRLQLWVNKSSSYPYAPGMYL